MALLVPATYVNESGNAVGPAAGALYARPEQVLVLHDEIDLAFGTVRGKAGGGHGGHNGLRSIAGRMGGGFARIRLGVGRPPADFRGDEAAWVLSRFSEPPEEVERLIERGVEMTELALAEGIDAAIAQFHAAPPGSRASRRAGRSDPEAGA